ncbi:MAG TPA: GxxExxY protein [Polyangia bacterium]|nr:GxxExxY protein [Polyangia bacterium]
MSIPRVVESALSVHRELGPGMHRSLYVVCLAHEMARAGLRFARDVPIPISFRGLAIDPFVVEFVVEEAVLVQVLAVESIRPSHQAQLGALLRHSGLRAGLLLNFHAPVLKQGIRKRVLKPEDFM